MKIPRVVLNTNVVVSAALGAQRLPAKLFGLVATGKVSLYLSEPTIQEYITVLARSKFARIDPPRLRRLVGLLNRKATRAAPRVVVSACSDEDDTRFLKCAQAARAHYLVTGNSRHFPERWKMTRIVTPRELFEAFDPGGELGEPQHPSQGRYFDVFIRKHHGEQPSHRRDWGSHQQFYRSCHTGAHPELPSSL